ncbi:MAG: hypothetical protein FJ294_12135 [Planctomycetes bacterium]|nr:hypothetical protein [Planctomycetota bacterium]
MLPSFQTALLTCVFLLGGLAAPAPAQGQTATLADGRVLTVQQPLELFITEGPVWDLNLPARSVTVVGRTVTIPASVDGVQFGIAGTAVTSPEGLIVGEIGAHNFDRLFDHNAIGRDTNAYMTGATRSVFSTNENLRQDSLRPASRNLAAQLAMQDKFLALTRDLVPLHSSALSANFEQLLGPPTADGLGRSYPYSSGGTFKSAGHVYHDTNGNRFLIPDIEAVLELSENVAGGVVTSVHPGGNGVPPSFTVDNLLVVFNQDPRFPASTIGLVGTEIPRSVFVQQAVGHEVEIVGFVVSEHVLFANEVITTLVDPTAPLAVVPTFWLFKNSGNEIRIRGLVDRPQGIALSARILNQTFPITLVTDPLTGGATFDFKTKGQLNVSLVTQVTLEARFVGAPAGTPLAFQQTYLRSVVAP